MTRKSVASRFALLAASLIVLPGCSLFQDRGPKGDPTIIPNERMRALSGNDRARLAGEDAKGSNAHVVLGVDTSGDSWYFAPLHVVGGFTLRVIERFNGETPLVDAKAMEDTRSPDHRREGILRMASHPFARRVPYTKRYAQIAQEGTTDPAVRAAAIRALNRSRDKTTADLYISSLENTDPSIRLEAAKALANIPAENAAPALIKHLGSDESKDVRIACADALREYKTLDVTRALINVLNDRDFAISWQARKSLNLMTGRDFRYDDLAWLDYFSKSTRPFL